MTGIHAVLDARRQRLAVVNAHVDDADTLEGLVVPVDPDRIRKLPRISRPQDLALFVALVGMALLDLCECRADALASVCRLSAKELRVALTRACGRRGDGAAKYFTATLRRGNRVAVSAVMKRLVRPERYVRLRVDLLAAAPTSNHARLYALCAEAAMGDESKNKNIVSAPLEYLGLDRHPDPGKALREMLDWISPAFATGAQGHLLSCGIWQGQAVIKSTNSCNWHYDHRFAPRPWIPPDAPECGTLDGRWEGHDLSVSGLRAAKVCEWVRREGCRLAPQTIRAFWLVALDEALRASARGKNSWLLRRIAETSATEAFEKWVLQNSFRTTMPTPAQQRFAEQARAVRRMAAANPDDPRLRPYAQDPVTGEQLTYIEFRWQVLDPLAAFFRDGNITRSEFREAVRQQRRAYRVAGTKPLPVRRWRSMFSEAQLKNIGVSIFMAGIDREDQKAAADLALALLYALSTKAVGPDTTLDELLDECATEEAITKELPHLRLAWHAAHRERSFPAEPLEQVARRMLMEAAAENAVGRPSE